MQIGRTYCGVAEQPPHTLQGMALGPSQLPISAAPPDEFPPESRPAANALSDAAVMK